MSEETPERPETQGVDAQHTYFDKPEADGNWPAGCGYQGYEFGASYPDSACYGGQLFDMDACDGEGNIYHPGEDIPCPMCRPKDAVEWHMTDEHDRSRAEHLVNDIRKNRQNGTEPWKRK